MAQRPCRACLTEITLERADRQQGERDLPPLVGSDKQVEWATRCRYHALLLLDEVLRDADQKPERIPLPPNRIFPGEEAPRLGELIARLYENDSARFWIDHAKDAQYAHQRIMEHGTEVNRTVSEIVTDLLLSVAGVTDAAPRDVGNVQSVLQPSAAARRRRVYGATLDAHVDRATATIRKALVGKRRPYVAVSGGKDSAAVAHLVMTIRPDVTLHWTDDELEYPETVDLMAGYRATYGDQLVISCGRSAHAGWFTPWTDAPYWRDTLSGTYRKILPADDWMAARGHDVTFLGTRGLESQDRARWLDEHGPLYRVTSGTGLRCCPIWDWPTDYVYQYLEREGVPLNPVYDRLAEIGVELERRRVGPLPLVPRDYLVNGWDSLLAKLEDRYGKHWS